MAFYVQKPVLVEAVQNRHGNEPEVVEFLNRHGLKWWAVPAHGIRVETDEGVVTVSFGDWVVYGPLGEVYSLTNDYFIRHLDPSQLSLFD